MPGRKGQAGWVIYGVRRGREVAWKGNLAEVGKSGTTPYFDRRADGIPSSPDPVACQTVIYFMLVNLEHRPNLGGSLSRSFTGTKHNSVVQETIRF